MKIPRLVLIGSKLALICTVAAVVLGLVNAVTAPVIVENRARALAEGLQKIASRAGLEGATIGEPRPTGESTSGYPIRDSAGEVAGYVVQLIGEGYGGDMQILAGYRPTGELFAAQLMENQETPGLGKKAESDTYMQKFVGYGEEQPIPVSKSSLDPAQADAITGATITYLGIARALSEGSDLSRELAITGGAQ